MLRSKCKFPFKRFLFLITMICAMTLVLSTTTNAFTDTSSMTDEEFFGEWNGSSWVTVGKINYEYNGGVLSNVETAAKAGNYSDPNNGAKRLLADYFKNRTTPVASSYSQADRDITGRIDLLSDHIYTAYSETQNQEFTVGTTNEIISINVLSYVSELVSNDNLASFILMARYKETSEAQFNSDEAGSNRPTLVITVNSTPYTFYTGNDTYIRAGNSYTDTNYSTEALLKVRDEGAGYSDNTMHSYLLFDISSLPSGTITNAVLNLYGRHTGASGNKSVMLFTWENKTWAEGTLTWSNHNGNTFSWQGQSGGFDWQQPATGAENQWIHAITRFGMINPFVAEYLYATSGNEAYASTAIGFMMDFIADADTYQSPYGSGVWPVNYDTAIRAGIWIKAYNQLKGSPQRSTPMDGAATAAILKTFWKTAEMLEDPDYFDSDDNHGTTETIALYKIAVYFPEFTDAGTWKSLAISRLDDMINVQVQSDGSFNEASTGYTATSLYDYLDLLDFVDSNNESLSSNFNTKIQKLAKFLMDTCTHDGYDPAYGDTGRIDQRSLINNIANVYNNQNLEYFGTGGSSGTVPPYTSILYPDFKMAVMRTGWRNDDLYMSINTNFDNEPATHGHYDELALVAYAYGRTLLVDPGTYTYNSDSVSHWLRRTTVSHNTVEVDGFAQDVFTRNGGMISSWHENDLFDFYEGCTDSDLVYRVSDTNYYAFKHYRDILFLKPNYWIVSDYLKAPSGTHDYNQTWHLLPDNQSNPSIDANTKKASTSFTSGANIQIVPADPDSLSSSLDDGYYSESTYTIQDAKYVSYKKSDVSGDQTFDTVLYPTSGAATINNVKVTRLITTPSVATTTATALKIELDYGENGNIGYYYLSHEYDPTALRSYDDFSYNGKMAYIEKDYNNNLLFATIKDGTYLKDDSNDIITNTIVPINEMGVKWNGTSLEIYSNDSSGLTTDTSTDTAIKIYAPSATSVKLNGTTIPYTKSGDYIYAVRQIDNYEYLLNEGFDNGTTGNSPEAWSVYAPTNTSVTVEENPGAYDKSVKMSDTNTSNCTILKKTFIPQKGIVTAEWSFKEETTAGTGMSMYLEGGGFIGPQLVTDSGPCLQYINSSGNWTTLININADTWYKVKIIANITTKTFDVYVNGELIGSGLTFRENATSLERITYISGWGADSSTSYINDVRIIGNSLINSNFNTDTTDGQPADWEIETASDTSVIIQNVPSAENKSVKLIDTNTSNDANIWKYFNVQKDTITAEWKFKEVSVGNGLTMCLMGGGYIGPLLATEGSYLKYIDNSQSYISIQNISDNTWYTVKIIVDIKAKTYNIYVDEVLKVTGAVFNENATELDCIKFNTGWGYSDTVYFDNIRLGGSCDAKDNFDGYTTNSTPSSPWVVTTASNTTCTITEDPNSTDKSMKLYDNNDGGFASAYLPFEPITSSSTIKWNFKTSYGGIYTGWEAYILYNSVGDDIIYLTTHDGNIYYKDDHGIDTLIRSYNYDTWYKLKIVADLVTNKYNIYIYDSNDTLLTSVAGISFRYMARCNEDITSVYFRNGYGYNGTLYINELNITQ